MKFKLSSLIVFLLLSVNANAQIAYVASSGTDLGNNSGVASTFKTGNYTIASGTGLVLVACIAGDTVADDITSVKWQGSSGTPLSLARKETTTGTNNRMLYLYYLFNPTATTNTIYVSASTTHYIFVNVAVYSGTSSLDSTTSASGSGSTTLTTPFTTVADSSWTVLCGNSYNGNAPETAGTGSTRRAFDGTFGALALFDSNAAVSPAGSYNMTIGNLLVSYHTAGASFAPPGAASSACGLMLKGICHN